MMQDALFPFGPSLLTPLVTIVGAGPVGTALAGRLTRSGVPVAALYGRTVEQAAVAGLHAGVLGLCKEVSPLVKSANVAIVAVADSKIGAVAEAALAQGIVGAHQVVLHTSGAWAAEEVLATISARVKAVGTLHPLASLSQRPRAHERLAHAAYAVEGQPEARQVAERLVSMMKGRALPLLPAKMPLYHAGAAIASNLVVALMNLARRVFEAAGVDALHVVPALVPLLRSTAENLSQQGLPQALTGPVARGDVTTVQRHLTALEAAVPDVADLYRRLGAEVLAVAAERIPELEKSVLKALQDLFVLESSASKDRNKSKSAAAPPATR